MQKKERRMEARPGQTAKVPLLALVICGVVGVVTLVEVHRSHSDAHEVREQLRTSGETRLMVQPRAAVHQARVQARSSLAMTPELKVSSQPAPRTYGSYRKAVISQPMQKLLSQFKDLLDEKDDIPPICHVEEHADYFGEEVLKWGHLHLKDSAGDCCMACMLDPNCNMWVYCGHEGGCGMGRSQKECWLKRASNKALKESVGQVSPDILWTSGMMVDPQDLMITNDKDTSRLKSVRNAPNTTLVYLDIAIKGKSVGRIVIALFYKESPLAAENFRQLCTGEKGAVPQGRQGAGGQYSFKGSSFYRIVDKFIDQSGANTDSVYGGMFKDDPGGLRLKHDRPGLLSMANTGPDTNTAHFSILMAPAPHLDGHYVVFGEVVEGMGVAWAINQVARGKKDNTAGLEEQVIITDCGQIKGVKFNPHKHHKAHALADRSHSLSH